MDEDLEREKWIIALQSCARKCLNDLDSISQEMEILRYMEQMKEVGKDPHQEVVYTIVEPVMSRKNYEEANKKPMQVIKIGTDLSVTKETIKANVFKPWWNLPTRSMADYAEEELYHMHEAERERESEAKPDMKYKELEEKGLEDDMELVDKATMRWEKRRFVTTRERHYEDWLDTIPKGIGNTKRISCVRSNKQAYWVSISLAPSSWSMSVGPS